MTAKITKKERKMLRDIERAKRTGMSAAAAAALVPRQPLPTMNIPVRMGSDGKVTVDREKIALISFWTDRCRELLQQKGDLTDDEKEYLAKVLGTMRDEKLKNIIAGLLGWGDDERAELQTFCAIALEIMQMSSSSTICEAARRVETNYYLSQMEFHKPTDEYYDEESFALSNPGTQA